MAFVGRLGTADVDVPAAQSIVVGSFGGGSAKVLYGTKDTAGRYRYALQAVVTNGATIFGSFASGQRVRVEASSGCDAEYATGTAPQLTQVNPVQMPTAQMGPTQRLRRSNSNALTAHAGGGQASGTALASGINRFTTVGTAADSALLPAALAGMEVIVINAAAANSMTVYPASGEAINALSADTGFAIAANKTAVFYCAVDGKWNTLVTA